MSRMFAISKLLKVALISNMHFLIPYVAIAGPITSHKPLTCLVHRQCTFVDQQSQTPNFRVSFSNDSELHDSPPNHVSPNGYALVLDFSVTGDVNVPTPDKIMEKLEQHFWLSISNHAIIRGEGAYSGGDFYFIALFTPKTVQDQTVIDQHMANYAGTNIYGSTVVFKPIVGIAATKSIELVLNNIVGTKREFQRYYSSLAEWKADDQRMTNQFMQMDILPMMNHVVDDWIKPRYYNKIYDLEEALHYTDSLRFGDHSPVVIYGNGESVKLSFNYVIERLCADLPLGRCR